MSDTGKGKIDLAQLVKILNLTQSDSDGEALNALRMANSKLKAADLTWQDILSPNFKPKPEPRQYKFKEAPSTFNAGFFRNAVERKEFREILNTEQREWVNELINYYNDHHYLPHKTWTTFAQLWYNFREAYRG